MFVSLLTLLFAGIMFATHDIGGSEEETENDQSDEREEDRPVEGEAPDTDPEPDQDTEPDMGASILEEDGTVTIELGEDETGSLLAVTIEDTSTTGNIVNGHEEFVTSYELQFYLVPAGAEFPLDSSNEGFNDPEGDEIDEIVADLGLEVLGTYDLGTLTFNDISSTDARIDPPEIQTDDPIQIVRALSFEGMVFWTDNDDSIAVSPIDPSNAEEQEASQSVTISEENGVTTIELGEDDTGSLLAVSFEDEYVPNDDGSSGGSAYSLVLYLVPEGVEVPTSRAEIAADLDDDPDNPLEEYDVTWQAVVEEYGLVRLESWNLGRIGSDHAAFYDGGEPAYWNSVVHPPELVSDASLDFLTVRGDDGALASVEAANAPLGLSNETLTIRYHSELGTGGDDTGETPNNGSFTNILTENVPSGGIFSAGDGNDAILAAPGSSVPIVIVTGQGEDEVTVGLNQTVVTGNLPDTYSEGDSLKEQSFDDTGGDIINVQIVDLDHATDDIEREIFADENDTVRYSVPTYGDAPAGSLVLIEAESVVIETGTDVEQGAYTTTLTEQSVHILFVPAVDGSAITSLPDTTSLSELLETYDAIQLDTFRTGLVESTLYEGTDTPEIIDMRNAYSAPVITSHLNVIDLRASEVPQQAA